MKNLRQFSKYSILFLMAIILISCSAEDGMDGAMGPQGLAGINGVDGADGQDGADGNANVFASEWIEPTEDSYSVNNPKSKSLPLVEPISNDIIHSGTILVYYDNDIAVYSLPYYVISSLTGELDLSVTSKLNHATRTLYLDLKKYTSDFTPREYLWNPEGPPYGKGVRFRYIIIPSNEDGKGPFINYLKMTYEEVMDHFGLKH